MTTSQASDEGAAVVPLPLLDDLLESVAGLLHDRPVQSLVAARLLLETAMAPVEQDDMVDRGLQAITSAGEQARDVMWALGGVSLRAGHVPEDVRDAMTRLAAPGEVVAVTVQIDDDIDVALVELVVQTVHEVLVEVMSGGGHVQRVQLVSDAEALHVSVHSGPVLVVADDSPWVRLARLRLRTAGGWLTHGPEGEGHTTEITLPLAMP